MAEFIDLAQFIRHVATEVFVADQDGFLGDWGMNNFYFYRPPISNQFRLIVWDKSRGVHGRPDVFDLAQHHSMCQNPTATV